MTVDPLAEPGPCRRCDRGWVSVQPDYAERQWPLPIQLPMDATLEEQQWHEGHSLTQMQRQVLYGDAVYPCKICQPEQFHRWARGEYARR